MVLYYSRFAPSLQKFVLLSVSDDGVTQSVNSSEDEKLIFRQRDLLRKIEAGEAGYAVS